jgi:glycosyltransferase involved in cell wall biosynthesis
MTKKQRLVIFIAAYQAESTLEGVLSRIPDTLFSEYECSILVVDDASQDRTVEVGHRYRRQHPELPLTVARNEFNQGYGGNQKVGYAHAIAENADVVALLHGDGQYAPEELPKLVAPVCCGATDAVFGSRMLRPGGALQGGMPLYKFIGNKLLTAVQNRLLGARLSEFHSGYRVYSVPLLKQLHFALNSNEFHFDSEIIIQILNAGGRILELPIPTHYGNEVCRVDGIKYAKDVMHVTLQNVAHRAGFLPQQRFNPLSASPRSDFKRSMPHGQPRPPVGVHEASPLPGVGARSDGVAPSRIGVFMLADHAR